ncbi:hypothetical protein CL621_00980 [archaeon]|nr:hypothetical protein [archaeon]|tara:strand:+ start:1111 stop:1401 length:291 start_codon:yes stop_codon:yes gene_type:complete
MIQVITGLISGTLTAAVAVVLIEKTSIIIKRLLIGHYVVTDIFCTYLAYSMLPVVGLATMISSAVFCLIFTVYLYVKRQKNDYITIAQLITGRFNV